MSGRAANPVRYAIGPLTTYADAGELRRLFARAKPGDPVPYAWGPALGKAAETPRVARELAAGGRGELFRRRTDAGLTYFIRKRSPGAAEGKGAAASRDSAAAPVRLGPGSPEARVLAVLEEAAGAGRVCPSNAELAELAGLPDEEAAKYRLRKLEAAGLILRSECGSSPGGGARSVTIVATGETTPCPTTKAPTGKAVRR